MVELVCSAPGHSKVACCNSRWVSRKCSVGQKTISASPICGDHVLAERLEPGEEELLQAVMPRVELAHHAGDQGVDLLVGELHDAGHDLHDPLLIHQLERPEQHAGVVRLEDDAGALDVHDVSDPSWRRGRIGDGRAARRGGFRRGHDYGARPRRPRAGEAEEAPSVTLRSAEGSSLHNPTANGASSVGS